MVKNIEEFNIIEYSKKFYNESINQDERLKINQNVTHRDKSWEYCRKAFLFYKNKDKLFDNEIDNLALNLAFYLASWGMYRPSSFLIEYDYKIHIPAVRKLMKPEYISLFEIDPFTDREQYLDLIFGNESNDGIYKELNDFYIKYRNNGKSNKTNDISPILITKILMGVYGCIPAYDELFKKGIACYGISQSANRRSVDQLLTQVEKIPDSNKICEILNNNKSNSSIYTFMKIVDMSFWKLGEEVIKQG